MRPRYRTFYFSPAPPKLLKAGEQHPQAGKSYKYRMPAKQCTSCKRNLSDNICRNRNCRRFAGIA